MTLGQTKRRRRDYLPRLRRSWRIFLRIFSYLCLRIFFLRFLITLLIQQAPLVKHKTRDKLPTRC